MCSPRKKQGCPSKPSGKQKLEDIAGDFAALKLDAGGEGTKEEESESIAKVMEHLKRSSNSESVIGFASLDSAARYLGMDEKDLKSACESVAETIKDKTVDELRETFGIVFHGFTASEESENRRVFAWAFQDNEYEKNKN